MLNRRRFQTAALAWAAMGASPSRGESDPGRGGAADSTGKFNIKTPTLGGKQLWADVELFHAWRIQQNVLSGHHRLLDASDTRHGWGTLEECRNKLAEIRRREELKPMQGEAVVVMHGLFRTRSAMEPLVRFLRKQGGLQVLNVGYPTTRGTVAQHAERFARLIDNLEGIEKIHIVAHSLGNLVVRHWLGDRSPQEAQGGLVLGRMVMLGPPNHRPVLARKLAPLDVTRQIGGHSLRQLAKDWDSLQPRLACPSCEFGIIAGGRGNLQGYNPLVPGDDDLVVSVASTRLEGARDFRLVPVVHTFLMNDPQVHRYVLEFLRAGHFETDDQRQPIGAGTW